MGAVAAEAAAQLNLTNQDMTRQPQMQQQEEATSSPPPPQPSPEPVLPSQRTTTPTTSNTTPPSQPQQPNTVSTAQASGMNVPSVVVSPWHRASTPLFASGLRCTLTGEDLDEREPTASSAQVSQWRVRDRMKTTTVSLVLCLNVGVDPPDVVRTSPCARLECWVDPRTLSPQKALEAIGKNLQAAYERWQPRARYKASLDPTVDDVRKLCAGQRRCARGERMLFHYNGHGVPKPTPNGELWVFNKSYTQYIPLSLYDLQHWVGVPAMYVIDCHAAGLALNAYCQFAEQRQRERESEAASRSGRSSTGQGGSSGSAVPTAPRYDYTRDAIILAACAANETLPQTQDLPADVFTSCLVTPIRTALLWLCNTSPLLRDEVCVATGLSCIDIVDKVPGKANDRRTPLGELNWVFTAVTDTIAWNALPRPLFQRLFRQDLLVASLFRNFLLACRLMRAHGCTPQSIPVLPPTHEHPIWRAWDAAAEACLAQLPRLLAAEGIGVSGGADGTPQAQSPVRTTLTGAATAASPPQSPAHLPGAMTPTPAGGPTFIPGTFFAEQLTAFEVWLDGGGRCSHPPEQLPVVLQVLLSQAHRLRALVLLGKFLDLGPWAVDAALSVGIFPYVLKLLQTTASDLRHILVFIWAKLLAVDLSCQVDLVKDGGHTYFLRFLSSATEGGDASSPNLPASAISREDHRAMAAFCLAQVCYEHPRGRSACWESHALGIASSVLESCMGDERSSLLTRWLCLLLGNLWDSNTHGRIAALERGVHELLGSLLFNARLPSVRASAAYALGLLISTPLEELDLPPSNASGVGAPASPLLVRTAQSNAAASAGTGQSLGTSAGAGAGASIGSQFSAHSSFNTLGANTASLTASPGATHGGADETMRGGSSVRSTGDPGTTPSTPGSIGTSMHGIGSLDRQASLATGEQSVLALLLPAVHDGSAMVRCEVACALARAAVGQGAFLSSGAQTPNTGVTPTSNDNIAVSVSDSVTTLPVDSSSTMNENTVHTSAGANDDKKSPEVTALQSSEHPSKSAAITTLEEAATGSVMLNRRTACVRVARPNSSTGTNRATGGDSPLTPAQLPATLHDSLLALSCDAHPAVARAAVEALTAAGVSAAGERPAACGGGRFWFESASVAARPSSHVTPSTPGAKSLPKGDVARSFPRTAPESTMSPGRKHAGSSWSPMGLFRRFGTSNDSKHSGSHGAQSKSVDTEDQYGGSDTIAHTPTETPRIIDGVPQSPSGLPGSSASGNCPRSGIYGRERHHFSRANLPSAFAEEDATERAMRANAAASSAEMEAASALASFAERGGVSVNPLNVVVGGANPSANGDACVTLAFGPAPIRTTTTSSRVYTSSVSWDSAIDDKSSLPPPPPPPPPIRLACTDRLGASRIVVAENGSLLTSLPPPVPPPIRPMGGVTPAHNPAMAIHHGPSSGEGTPSSHDSGTERWAKSVPLGVGMATQAFTGMDVSAAPGLAIPPVYSFVVQDDPSAEHALLGVASNDGAVRFYSGWNASAPSRFGAMANGPSSALNSADPPPWMEESMRLVDDLFRESTGTGGTDSRRTTRSPGHPELVAAFRAVPFDADANDPRPGVVHDMTYGHSPTASVTSSSSFSFSASRPGSTRCVFEWQAGSELLYSGGVGPQVYVWDARAERLAATVTLGASESATALCAARALLIAGSSGGSLALYDLRDPSPTTLALHRTHPARIVGARIVNPGGVGVAAEPTHPGFLLATAAANGELHLSDLRKPGEPIRRVEAHGSWMSRLAAHPLAPLLATIGGCGSAKTEKDDEVGVVRVWSGDGSLLSTVHAPAVSTAGSMAGGPAASLGPTCVAFHPRQLMLGIGLSNGSVTCLGCSMQQTTTGGS